VNATGVLVEQSCVCVLLSLLVSRADNVFHFDTSY